MKTMGLILSSALLLCQGSYAASPDSTRTAPFHLSFITPMGTNGLQSWNTTNNLSLNLFAGFSGGLRGIELSGFASVLRGDMKGIQVAGFCNNTFGLAEGAELAGFWNFNNKDVKGLQGSGFANIAVGFVDGFQASGFANYARGVSFGQVSGFANLSTGPATGIQAAGFANVTAGDQAGVQASGFSNIVTGRMDGLQASGFFNYAGKLRGVQAGVINYTDSLESGIPVGLFSFVRNGYMVLEIGGNESLYGTISLKTGVTRFYTILSLGAAVNRENLWWGWGYGIGTLLPLSARFHLGIEGVSYHLNENRWFSSYYNSLNRLNLNVIYDISPVWSICAGPSVSTWVSGLDRHGESHAGPPAGNWLWYDRPGNRSRVSVYPGFTAGIRIRINKVMTSSW